VYTYVYDSFVTEREHERLLARVESRLTDLGISGRIERLTMFKDIRDIVADAVARGCETVVAVGNDETVSKLVDVLGDFDVALGLIPIGEGPHRIAEALGSASDIEACNVLSRRVLHKVDLGRINEHWFLSSVEIPETAASVSCNGQYAVVPAVTHCVRVCNLASLGATNDGVGPYSSPRDGYLETVISPVTRQGFFSKFFRPEVTPPAPTVVPVRTLDIKHQRPFAVVRDGVHFSSTRLQIEIVPQKLKVVVGRDRKFA
jgi:diacylglycerol kinase family enzyme